jgi:hypothetical protein
LRSVRAGGSGRRVDMHRFSIPGVGIGRNAPDAVRPPPELWIAPPLFFSAGMKALPTARQDHRTLACEFGYLASGPA